MAIPVPCLWARFGLGTRNMNPNTPKKPLNDSATASPSETPRTMLTRRIDMISNNTSSLPVGASPDRLERGHLLFLCERTSERNTNAEDTDARAATTNIMLSRPGVPKIRPPFLSLPSWALDQSCADITPSTLFRSALRSSRAFAHPLEAWSQSSNIHVVDP